jgi:hypothetical protein
MKDVLIDISHHVVYMSDLKGSVNLNYPFDDISQMEYNNDTHNLTVHTKNEEIIEVTSF